MKSEDVFKEDDNVVRFLKDVIQRHSGRGAYNVIMAKCNEELRKKVLRMTQFLDYAGDDFSFADIRTRIYMLMNGMSADDFPRCCTCGNVIRQNIASFSRGFIYNACSVKCAANRKGRTEQIRKTKLERHGDPNYVNGTKISETLKSMPAEEREQISRKAQATREKHKLEDPEFQHKIAAKSKATRLHEHGNENWNNPEKISATKRQRAEEDSKYYEVQAAKGKETKRLKYGDENFNNREKDRQTRLERYGDAGWNNREQAAETCLDKYGVDNPAKAECVKQKTKETCQREYGASCFLASEQHKQHSKQVCLERYGVAHPMQCKEIHQKVIDIKSIRLYDKIVASDDEVLLLSSQDEFIARNELSELKWHCKKCGRDFYAKPAFAWHRAGGHWARCMNCYPVCTASSLKQNELLEFIKSICPDDDIASCDRHAIAPYEIDILDKTRKTGFEFDGLYWHSELAGCKKPLKAKTDLCNAAGLQLVHVLEDEWDLRKEQCKAKICEVLGVYDACSMDFEVQCISRQFMQEFLDANCYDLFARASAYNFAAVSYSDEVLACIGMSMHNGVISFHHPCCSIEHVNGDILAKLAAEVIKHCGAGMHVQLKHDGRWPLSWCNRCKMQLARCTVSRRWAIDTAIWRRIQKYMPDDSSLTFITDCGQCIYDVNIQHRCSDSSSVSN